MHTFVGVAFETIIVLALVIANGFFVAAEFALVKVRASQLHPLAKSGGWRVKFALKATEHLDAALSATQLSGRRPFESSVHRSLPRCLCSP